MASVVANDGSWAFVHIPKTAGTWVTAILRRTIPECRTLLPYADHPDQSELLLRGLIEPHAYTFTFVRHPLTWYVSFWRHLVAALQPLPRPWLPELEPSLHSVLDHHGPFWTINMTRYTRSVDFVGRQEQVRADLAQVLPRLSPEIDARRAVMQPRVLPGPQLPPPRTALSPELLERIYAMDGPAMERFGYTQADWQAAAEP